MKSEIRFHGTPLRNLRSIIHTGFCGYTSHNTGSKDDARRDFYPRAGVWSAPNPADSHGYTMKEARHYRFGDGLTSFPGNPVAGQVDASLPYRSSDQGILFGCEHATDKGPVENNFPEPVAHSLLPRYIFVVPAKVLHFGNSESLGPYPRRSQIEAAMRKGFAKFRNEEIAAGGRREHGSERRRRIER